MTVAIAMMYKQGHKIGPIRSFYSRHLPVHAMECDFLEKPEEYWRNEFTVLYPEIDWWLTIDTDEVLLSRDLKGLLTTLEREEFGDVDIYATGIEHYTSPTTVIRPKSGHLPTVAVSKFVKFTDKRCSDRRRVHVLPFDIHHLWYLHQGDREANYKARGILKTELLHGESVQCRPPKEVKEVMEAMA